MAAHTIQIEAQTLLMGVNDVAKCLGVSRSTVYGLMGSGALDARKLGERTVITSKSVRDYVASLPAAVSLVL